MPLVHVAAKPSLRVSAKVVMVRGTWPLLVMTTL